MVYLSAAVQRRGGLTTETEDQAGERRQWQKLTAWAIGGRRTGAGGARGGRRIGVSSVEPVVRLDVHRPQEQLAEHRHPRVVVERDHRVSRQEEDDHLP